MFDRTLLSSLSMKTNKRTVLDGPCHYKHVLLMLIIKITIQLLNWRANARLVIASMLFYDIKRFYVHSRKVFVILYCFNVSGNKMRQKFSVN